MCIDGMPASATRAAVVEPKQPTDGPSRANHRPRSARAQAGAGTIKKQEQTRGWQGGRERERELGQCLGNAISWDEKGLVGWIDGTGDVLRRLGCQACALSQNKALGANKLIISFVRAPFFFWVPMPKDARAGWEARGPRDARAWGRRQAVHRT